MGNKCKTRKVELSVEYSDEMTPECKAGLSLLADMIINHRQSLELKALQCIERIEAGDFYEGIFADLHYCDPLKVTVPDYLKDSVIVSDLLDAGYWGNKMKEMANE